MEGRLFVSLCRAIFSLVLGSVTSFLLNLDLPPGEFYTIAASYDLD